MNTSPKVLGFVLICADIFPSIAMAESDFQVGGAVGIQSKQVEFSYSDINLKPTFQMITYALTASYGRFFANLELEAMIEGDSQYYRDTSSNRTVTFDFKRSDSTITLGYNLWRGLSVFGGYKQGETEATLSSVAFDIQQLVVSEKGPFAGIAYGQPIGKKGTLAVSAAYASFDAESIVRFVGFGAEFKSGGTTSGLSYGVSWTGSLSESSYYRLSYKINEYRFKDKDQVFADTSTDENYRIVGLSVGTNF